jgi:hypothetical protein
MRTPLIVLASLLLSTGHGAPYDRFPCQWLLKKGAYRANPLEIREGVELIYEFSRDPEFATFQHVDNALFLGDDRIEVDARFQTHAQKWSKIFPHVNFISADIISANERISDNLTSMHIDHTKKFPLADNSQDLIVLSRGFCKCHGAECCAGFEPRSTEAWNFFSEVLRVLNKDNPQATAYLQGSFYLSTEDHLTWSAMLDHLNGRYPQFKYAFYSRSGDLPLHATPEKLTHLPDFLKIWIDPSIAN